MYVVDLKKKTGQSEAYAPWRGGRKREQNCGRVLPALSALPAKFVCVYLCTRDSGPQVVLSSAFLT